MHRLKELLKHSEGGQTLIFAAVMASVLMAITGVAVEAGHMFVEYRHMQAAADMAALTGAQKLPCNLTDTTCAIKAEKDACNYAQLNGYGGGWGGATSSSPSSCQTGTKTTGFGNSTITVTASVPPVSCSPYDFLDYGNNSSCPGRAASTLDQYVFIEVQITEPVTVPIFNISFTLSAHAVAKQGVASPNDFAVSVLDQNVPGALTMGGSGSVVVVGDTMSNGSVSITGCNGSGGCSAQQISCDGSWYTAASEAVPGNSSFVSNLSGSPNFADAACAGGTTINPASFFPQSPPIPDPYGSTQQPTSTNIAATCPECANSQAYYYTWDPSVPTGRSAGTWSQANSSKLTMNGNKAYELFPGEYPGDIDDTAGATIYLNPGVYTLDGDFKTNGSASMCIYGAPACDMLSSTSTIGTTGAQCANATFTPSDPNNSNYVDPKEWYYYCSPWGVWDTKLSRNGAPGGGPNTNPPIFYDPTGKTTMLLNGVTFYMKSGSFNMNGSASMYVAYPNACPGTGSGASTGSVPFSGNPIGEPSGQTDFAYTYPPSSVAAQDTLQYSTDVKYNGSSAQVYPSADLTRQGDVKCSNGLTTWQNEFPNKPTTGQHLQFLIFADNTSTSVSLNGNASQEWWGILHTFPQNYSGYPGPPTQDCGSNAASSPCNITISGSSGGGSSSGSTLFGPPFLVGQTVSGTATFTGSASVEIFYRPCKALTAPCGTGPGTALIQ